MNKVLINKINIDIIKIIGSYNMICNNKFLFFDELNKTTFAIKNCIYNNLCYDFYGQNSHKNIGNAKIKHIIISTYNYWTIRDKSGNKRK